MKLLNENKTAKYLKYAIGEIVLIIVGILFALQISNWNEARKAQTEFDLYIVQLKEDVRTAIESAEGSVGINEKVQSESDYVLTFLELSTYNEAELAGLELGLTRMDIVNEPYVYIGLLGEILNGDMKIIGRDPGLTKKAQEMVTGIGRRLGNIDQMVDQSVLTSDRFVSFRSKGSTSMNKAPRYNLETLKSSDEFGYAIDNLISLRSNVINFTEAVVRHLEAFLVALDEYE